MSWLLAIMLCTAEQVALIPGFANVAARPVAWVNMLIGAADLGIKQYCKRDLELTAYVDVYDGELQRDLVLRQRPAWLGAGFLDPSMQGVALPQATIAVLSTQGFHPGTAGNPNAQPPSVGIQVGVNQWTWINYTGTTATSFTGCTGGAGTMALNPGNSPTAPYSVFSPVVHFDPLAQRGQVSTAFGPGTQLVGGLQYTLLTDKQGSGSQTPVPVGCKVSERGLLRYGGGASQFFSSGWPPEMFGRQLAGSRRPVWPRCHDAIRVMYSAGYFNVPADLSYAAAMLVCQMVRIQPTGENLASQNLGAYGYSVLMGEQDPAMGTIRRILARYREPAFASGS